MNKRHLRQGVKGQVTLRIEFRNGPAYTHAAVCDEMQFECIFDNDIGFLFTVCNITMAVVIREPDVGGTAFMNHRRTFYFCFRR